MTINPTFIVDNQSGVAQSIVNQWQLLAAYAIDQWSTKLAGSTDIVIRLEILDMTISGRGQGGQSLLIDVNGPGGTAVEGGVAWQLRHGVNPNGSDADIYVQVQASYLLNTLFLDPTPETADDIPSNRTDGLSALLHEFGHSFGMIGYYQEQTDTFISGLRTSYDWRISLNVGEVYFTGPNTSALIGGPLLLTDNNYTHYGNTSAHPSGGDPLTGLMNGVIFYNGYRYSIGALDLAFMADMGMGTVNDDIFDQIWLDVLQGGPGDDTFAGDYSDSPSAVTINATGATFLAPGLTLHEMERLHVTLSAHADTVLGGPNADRVHGGGGNDSLAGNGGDDALAGGLGDDTLDGGSGFDTADYSDALGGVLVALYKQAWVVKNQTPGSAGSDILTNFEALQGGAFNDYLLGSPGADTLRGGGGGDELESFAGNDELFGEDGNDLLIAGDGDDALDGGAGDDFLSGQLGNDTLNGGAGDDTFAGGGGNDVLNGGSGSDHLFGGDGNDTIDTGDGDNEIAYGDSGDDQFIVSGAGSAEIQGGTGADTIEVAGSKRIEAFGEDGADTVRGGGADDYVSAGPGDDFLYGNGGADRLIGGAGNDHIEGGAGDDFLWGFADADKFVFASGFTAGQFDTIRDFEDGVDKIVLPTSLQNAVTISSSAFGSFVSVATPQGQIGILVEDLIPANLTLAGDFLFV